MTRNSRELFVDSEYFAIEFGLSHEKVKELIRDGNIPYYAMCGTGRYLVDRDFLSDIMKVMFVETRKTNESRRKSLKRRSRINKLAKQEY